MHCDVQCVSGIYSSEASLTIPFSFQSLAVHDCFEPSNDIFLWKACCLLFGLRASGRILSVCFYVTIKSKVLIHVEISGVLFLYLFISVPFSPGSSGTSDAVVQADYLALAGGECDGCM